MADVATSAPAAGDAANPKSKSKDHKEKPPKPDEEAFKKNLAAAQAEHQKVREQLMAIKEKVDLAQSGQHKNPRAQALKDELSQIRTQQASKKSSKAKLDDQIKALDASIKNKIKDQQASRGKVPYKNVQELDAAISRLQAKVDGAQLKIVEERKALAEISALNKQRRSFGEFEEKQKSIDQDREKLNKLRDERKDPEVVELSQKYDEINKQLNEIKEEQDEAFKNLSSLRDQRGKLYTEQQEKWQAIQDMKTEHYAAKDAYRQWTQEANKVRQEKYQKQKEEEDMARKRKIAEEKMEEASRPAFATEIMICEGLIAYFDPSSAEAARKAKQEAAPSALAAKPGRSVTDDGKAKGTVLVKKEEDYFVGGATKKKGKKGRGAAEKKEESEPSTPSESAGGKFNLNLGIIEELGKVGVDTPSGKDEVPKTLETLREKLKHYKDNQDKTTKENIAKAQKELDKTEKQAENGENGTTDETEPAEETTNGEEKKEEEATEKTDE